MKPATLKRTREQFSLKTMDLAGHLGVSGQTITRWENGNLEMPLGYHRLLALLVERWIEHGYVSAEELWGNTFGPR